MVIYYAFIITFDAGFEKENIYEKREIVIHKHKKDLQKRKDLYLKAFLFKI